MEVGFLGLSYKDASLVELEKVYLRNPMILPFWAYLNQVTDVTELTVLSTCNRVEIYFASPNVNESARGLKAALSTFLQVSYNDIDSLYHVKLGADALQHLFHVASGMESMIFGENEILTQLKQAHGFAMENQTSGSLLNKCFNCAIAAGKRVRTDTLISKGAHSVSSVAIDLAKEMDDSFFQKRILVVGAGTIGRRVLTKLQAMGHSYVTIANKTDRKAIDISVESGCYYLPYYELKSSISSYDLVFYATSAKGYLLREEDEPLLSESTIVVDLGMPRNVDPYYELSESMSLISIGDLESVTQRTKEIRMDEIAHVEQILAEELLKLTEWAAYREHSLAAR